MNIRVVSALLHAASIFHSDKPQPYYILVREHYNRRFTVPEIRNFYEVNREEQFDNIKIPRSIERVVINYPEIVFLVNWLGYPDTDLLGEDAYLPLKDLEDDELEAIGRHKPALLHLIYSNCEKQEQIRLKKLFPNSALRSLPSYRRAAYSEDIGVKIVHRLLKCINEIDLDSNSIIAFANAFEKQKLPVDYNLISYYYDCKYTPTEIRKFYSSLPLTRPHNEYVVRRFRKLLVEKGAIYYFVDWYGYDPSTEMQANLISMSAFGVIKRIFELPLVVDKLSQIMKCANAQAVAMLRKEGIGCEIPKGKSLSSLVIELEEPTDFVVTNLFVRKDLGVMMAVKCLSSTKCSLFTLSELEDKAIEAVLRVYEYEMASLLAETTTATERLFAAKFKCEMPPSDWVYSHQAYTTYVYVPSEKSFASLINKEQKCKNIKAASHTSVEQIAEPVQKVHIPTPIQEQPNFENRELLLKDKELCFQFLLNYL